MKDLPTVLPCAAEEGARTEGTCSFYCMCTVDYATMDLIPGREALGRALARREFLVRGSRGVVFPLYQVPRAKPP
jgi:hypothetical protein